RSLRNQRDRRGVGVHQELAKVESTRFGRHAYHGRRAAPFAPTKGIATHVVAQATAQRRRHRKTQRSLPATWRLLTILVATKSLGARERAYPWQIRDNGKSRHGCLAFAPNGAQECSHG